MKTGNPVPQLGLMGEVYGSDPGQRMLAALDGTLTDLGLQRHT